MTLKWESGDASAALRWLDGNWQYAGIVAGLFYLAILPLMNAEWAFPKLLLWLQLPAYIVHQLEEHVHDRFRRYVNTNVGRGQEVLTSRAVTAINIGGVWCVDFLALYLTKFLGPGWALLAFYLAIVNAVIHIVSALVARAYNPGLITAVLLLLPLGIWGAVIYTTAHGLSMHDHLMALAFIIALHLVIIRHMLGRRSQLARVA